MYTPVTDISMTVPLVTFSTKRNRLISKSLNPGFLSSDLIFSIRSGLPDRTESISRCLRYW